MSHQDKYEENEKWADCAYSHKCYNVAVNRYYYSIFQRMLNKLAIVPNSYQRDVGGAGSHNDTAKMFVNKFCPDFKKRTKFNTNFQKLKQIRHQADYGKDNIDDNKARLAKNTYIALRNVI